MAGQPGVLIDRDGVVNARSPWIYVAPERLSLVEGAVEAIAGLTEAGYRVAVVTNQPWVGYGLLDPDRLEAFHEHIRREVEEAGGRVDAFFYCPHRHGEACRCRKPKTGMLEDAADELGIDPEASWMVGDKPTDVEAGRAFGARTVWVTGERFVWERSTPDPPADVTVDSLAEAVEAILAAGSRGGQDPEG